MYVCKMNEKLEFLKSIKEIHEIPLTKLSKIMNVSIVYVHQQLKGEPTDEWVDKLEAAIKEVMDERTEREKGLNKVVE